MIVSHSDTARYFRVCPRGFVNEATYIRVLPSQVEAVERYFAQYEDRQFGLGETGASAGWTARPEARRPGAAISWQEYLSEEF